MRTISKEGSLRSDALELGKCLLEIGRKRSLRDPIASSIEAEFTHPQIHSLTWLGFDGPLTMGALARRCCITEKTITGIVDRMERLNLFVRVRNDDDRRVVRVKLTKEGEAAFEKMRESMLAKLVGMMQLLDAEDRKGLLRIFSKLKDRIPDRDAPGRWESSQKGAGTGLRGEAPKKRRPGLPAPSGSTGP